MAILILVVAAGLAVAPLTYMKADVFDFFLPWARASGGRLPWAIYAARADCNYPPLWLYLLTIVERLRLLLGASPTGSVALVLLKLPSLLALGLGALGCARYLRPDFGERAARVSALAVLSGIGVWIDAAVWGQAEMPLCLLLCAAAWALLAKRPLLAGLFTGLALTLKPLAIIAVPFLFVYALRRLGAKATVQASVTALATVGLVILPFLLPGTAAVHGVIDSYTGAAGLYPLRSCGAYNFWYLTVAFDRTIRHMPVAQTDADNIAYLGFLTARQIGLGLFAVLFVPLVVRLWRAPSPKFLLLGIALGYLTFFTTCTEMHERYILPGIVFLAMVYGVSGSVRRVYPAWNVVSGLNVLGSLLYMNQLAATGSGFRSGLPGALFRGGSVALAFLECLLFVLTAVAFYRDDDTLSPSGTTAPAP